MSNTAEHKKHVDLPDAEALGGKTIPKTSAAELRQPAAERSKATVGTSPRAVDQGHDAIPSGLRAMAAAQAPLADASLAQGRRMLENAAGVANIYREATEAAAADTQALIAAYTTLGRGMQRWQHATLDLVQRSAERASGRWQRLSECNTPVEFAELQRELYLGAVDAVFVSSTTLLQLFGQITQDAVRPLQERTRVQI